MVIPISQLNKLRHKEVEELTQVNSRSLHIGPGVVFFTLILCYLSDALPVYQVTPSLAEQKYSPLKVKVLVVQSCPTLVTHGPLPAWLHCPWDSPGNNTGVDSHSLPQEVFLAQGSNPGLLP